MTESETPPLKQKHVVILVNGIHSRGQWMDIIKSDLVEKGFIVNKTSYKLFNVVELLLPFSFFKNMAVKRAKKSILASISMHPNARFYIIAHSFGTYLVSRIINELEEIPFHRIIFCGSIVDEGQIIFDKNKIIDFPEDGNWILNEVGGIDWLPVFAQNLTFGFGSVGSNGYNQPYVETRHHEGVRHSDFFTNSFCNDYWLPFLENGEVIQPNPYNYSSVRLTDKIRNFYSAFKKNIITLNYYGIFSWVKFTVWFLIPLYLIYPLAVKTVHRIIQTGAPINSETLYKTKYACVGLQDFNSVKWKSNFYESTYLIPHKIVVVKELQPFIFQNQHSHRYYRNDAEDELQLLQGRFPSLHFELIMMQSESINEKMYGIILASNTSKSDICYAYSIAKNCVMSVTPYILRTDTDKKITNCFGLYDSE